MRIFVAGAGGVIGVRLVPLLVANGHHVVATTRTPSKLDALRRQGAAPVVLDALDRNAVVRAVEAARPEVVVHEMTAIASLTSLRHFDEAFAPTNRLRTEGTAYLLSAAQSVGARKFVAQSFAGWPAERRGSFVKTEDDRFDQNPPRSMRESLDAIRALETSVVGARAISGIVLRYGGFYGPGTSISYGGEVIEMVRQRKFPVIGDGAGMWSFLHIDDAARATQSAIEAGPPGVYNIVDDDPAPVAEWLPELAQIIGAPPPRRIPVWLARILAGDAMVSMMTTIRGASNAKAKRVLSWQPRYSSWREGFRNGLAAEPSRARFLRVS